MAVVRARSSPPYGLFGAVAFAAIATAGAVILYVMWNKTVEERDVALKNSTALATTSEIGKLRSQYPDVSNKTYVAQLTTSLDAINKELADAKNKLEVKTAALNGTEENVSSLRKAVEDANATIKNSGAEVANAQQGFTKDTATLRDEIKKLNEQVAALSAEKDRLVKEGEDKLNAFMDQAEGKNRDNVLKLEDAQTQIAKLNAEVRDLRQRIINQGGKTDVNVGDPDGRVVRVNGATGEVYINLGEDSRISPGMPFTAYDPRTGVRFGTEEAALGDGSIEVISVGKDSSICRITRTSKDRAIQAGDLISNIVYHNDKTRKYHFTVCGDFDLDGDGVYTAAERDRLIVLIKRWGGDVDNDVTSQTDYLVLGAKPKAPFLSDTGVPAAEPTDAPANATAPATEAAPAAPAAIIGGVGEIRSKEQARYEDFEISAKRLAIPVLNANRFLAMVGYYNTTVVRY